MAKLEMYPTLKAETFLNLNAYWFYKISSILQNVHIMPKDNDGNVFYVNNYID